MPNPEIDIDQARKLVGTLRAMKGPNDGKGAYLGDGIPRTGAVPIRSIEIADLLDGLLSFYQEKS